MISILIACKIIFFIKVGRSLLMGDTVFTNFNLAHGHLFMSDSGHTSQLLDYIITVIICVEDALFYQIFQPKILGCTNLFLATSLIIFKTR